MIIRINKVVGLKIGLEQKSLSILSNVIPLIGGVIGGGIDFLSTRVMGEVLINVFVKKMKIYPNTYS